MPTTDPYTPEQVRQWRRSLAERIASLEEESGVYDATPTTRAYRRGRISGMKLAQEVLDDLFGLED